MSPKQVWTKRCKAGITCTNMVMNDDEGWSPAFIPDDALYGVCSWCLKAIFNLEDSLTCSCCGAGEDAVTEKSVFSAISYIRSNDWVVPKYVAKMWNSGDVMGGMYVYRFGIFDTDDDPVTRKPIEEEETHNRDRKWISTWKRYQKRAQQLNEDYIP